MDGSKETARPVWGVKKSWASSPSTSSTSTREPSPSSSSSAFPPLSSPAARRPSSRPTPSPSASSSLISSNSFNPYPTRRQELAQRAASNSARKRSHITRSDPATSRIHSILDYTDDDDALMYDDTLDDEEGEVSSRGATMSSIVFRDLSSAGTSRSSSPWQQGGMSAGLAMFATTTFGGEPLRVLANVDEELGAAHMGPRIYKRHNQKHVRNRVKAKIDAGHTSTIPAAVAVNESATAGARASGPSSSKGSSSAMMPGERDALQSLDLQKLVDECRRHSNLLAIQSRTGTDASSPTAPIEDEPARRLVEAVQARIADHRTWTQGATNSVISGDLLPCSLQQPPIDFTVLPPPIVNQIRHAVLHGISRLLTSIMEATWSELVETLSHLFSTPSLRPTASSSSELRPSIQQTFLQVLDTIATASDPSVLFAAVLQRCSTLPRGNEGMDEDSDALVDLVGELVGICGQQMSSNPTVLTETQDRTLVSAASSLTLLYNINSTRPQATRLPAHAFYCTVLDLAPFLEHFVHHAASLARTGGAASSGMAEFNICRYPFLLSLGGKVRTLQLENELRLSQAPRESSSSSSRFAHGEAELVMLPTSMNLKIEREHAWPQSRQLFLQLLEGTAGEIRVRGLRVEFAGEHAADGGGPAREWFATVANGWDYRCTMGAHGWFTPASSVDNTQVAERDAAFLGLILALAALHTTKVALPSTLPAVAFKIATAPSLESLSLTPVDLEFADAPLAKSLQEVLEWTPPTSLAMEDQDKAFDSTFSLTWSTTIRTATGEIKTIDLVPGGRHRPVKVAERKHFVSKLIFHVLIGAVRAQLTAFRDAWQMIFPSAWLAAERRAADSATEVLNRGGLALSLFTPEEIGQAILSLPSSSNSSTTVRLDVAELEAATEIISASASSGTRSPEVGWFWKVWAGLEPVKQWKLLAFITGADDLPASGARGVGLRVHVVPTDAADECSWPLPWSSTCTSTLFLPTYPSAALLKSKVAIAIEHYQGFGLR